MARAVSQATFQREVLESSAPVLVSFWAPWCSLCRLVDPMLSELKASWKDEIQFISINADDSLQLASAYKLRSLPTVMLFNDGKMLCRFEEFCDREDFRLASTELQVTLEKIVRRYSYSL
jgi:thioredoxin 1